MSLQFSQLLRIRASRPGACPVADPLPHGHPNGRKDQPIHSPPDRRPKDHWNRGGGAPRWDGRDSGRRPSNDPTLGVQAMQLASAQDLQPHSTHSRHRRCPPTDSKKRRRRENSRHGGCAIGEPIRDSRSFPGCSIRCKQSAPRGPLGNPWALIAHASGIPAFSPTHRCLGVLSHSSIMQLLGLGTNGSPCPRQSE